MILVFIQTVNLGHKNVLSTMYYIYIYIIHLIYYYIGVIINKVPLVSLHCCTSLLDKTDLLVSIVT